MTEIKEIRVEDHLRSRVKSSGGEVRKLVFPSHNGAPDRLVGWADYGHALIELKRPKGPGAEDHQKREHKRLRRIGFRVFTMHTIKEVNMFVDEASGAAGGPPHLQREVAHLVSRVHDLANTAGLTVSPVRDAINDMLGRGDKSLASLTAAECHRLGDWIDDPTERALIVDAAKART